MTIVPEVPWDQVGDGWLLVGIADSVIPLETSLGLVEPNGGLYRIEGIESTACDWSPDRQFLLLDRRTRLLDLVTGEITDLGVLARWEQARFTRPTGRNLMLVGDTAQLEWRSRSGELLGVIANEVDDPHNPMDWIYSTDGTGLVLGNGDDLLHLAADSRLILQLDTPGTACRPVKWWADGRVLTACLVDDGSGQLTDALFLIPLDGGPGERISPDPSLHPNQGYSDAWPYAGGVMVQWARYGCGGGQYLIHPDETIEDLHWDVPNAFGTNHVIKVDPNRIILYHRWSAANTGSLVAVTLSTGDVEVLIPGDGNAGVMWVATPDSKAPRCARVTP